MLEKFCDDLVSRVNDDLVSIEQICIDIVYAHMNSFSGNAKEARLTYLKTILAVLSNLKALGCDCKSEIEMACRKRLAYTLPNAMDIVKIAKQTLSDDCKKSVLRVSLTAFVSHFYSFGLKQGDISSLINQLGGEKEKTQNGEKKEAPKPRKKKEPQKPQEPTKKQESNDPFEGLPF